MHFLRSCFWFGLGLCLAILSTGTLRAQSFQLPQPVAINYQQGLPQAFVTTIVQDQQGFIWAGTRDGLARYDGQTFKVFRPSANGRPSLSYTGVRGMTVGPNGQIWLNTEQNDIDIFDPRTETFTNFSQLSFFARALPKNKYGIRGQIPDHRNRYWVVTGDYEVALFDLRTHQVRWCQWQGREGVARAKSIVEDDRHRIWIVTFDGLAYYDESAQRFVAQTPSGLPEPNQVLAVLPRPNGDLLISSANYVSVWNPQRGLLRTYPIRNEGRGYWGSLFAQDSRGAVYLAHRDYLYRFTQQGPQVIDHFPLDTRRCLSLMVDRSDVLWIGTDGSGILKYDLRANPFRTGRYQTGFVRQLLDSCLNVSTRLSRQELAVDPYFFRFTLDHQGLLWVNAGMESLYRIDLRTRRLAKIALPFYTKRSEKSMVIDERNRLLVYDLGRIHAYEPGSGHWLYTPYRVDEQRTGSVLQMVLDRDAFWLATAEKGLFRLDRRTGQLRPFAHQPTDSTSLSSNTLISLSTDPADPNRLWIGTYGSGLCAFDKRTGRSRRITSAQGLPNNVIYSTLPDASGNLWMGTNRGLSRLNRRTFQIKNYTHEDGLLADEFNRFHYLYLPGSRRAKDDYIIMAGLEGFTAFHPADLVDDHYQPRTELTNLLVNNKPIVPTNGSALSQPIQAVSRIELPYDQNFLTLRFAALQFNNVSKTQYRYQLEGLDPTWVETSLPQATYTALAPGAYTLLVNASNTSRIWSTQVRRLHITILPPWWRTWWAYSLYLIVLGSTVWAFIRSYLNRLRLSQAVQLKEQELDFRQKEAQQLRTVDEMKTRFFTNITHEFRTPLTLILAPTDFLLTQLEGTDYTKHLATVQRNARQLLGLINQLLDLSKLEAQLMPVEESVGKPHEQIAELVQSFQPLALAKFIRLTYHPEITRSFWYDPAKLERIVSNLLSNALKFTMGQAEENGQVELTLTEAQEGLQLTVSDTGIGIPADRLTSIFTRFYQVDDSSTRSQEGTGIGLSLVKELVELQGGRISVLQINEPGQPWKTRFTVWLPYRRAEESAEPGVPATRFKTQPLTAAYPNGPSQPDPEDKKGEHPVLLLAEDNTELAEFIADSLADRYQIHRVANGQEGFEQAVELIPDLIISDVLMPVLNGYDLCHRLKTDPRTNHIPVILLTAKASLDDRLEGLTEGADDYLTKPFHLPELQLRIHNQLEQRRRIRDWLRQSLTEVDTPEPAPLPLDPFLQKVYALLAERLDDSSFGADELASQLAITRQSLNRKLKALTSYTTRDFIRTYRLKQATELLRQGFNSSETAYRVGFDSPAYFTKCFRELYGITPTEYTHTA